MTATAPRSASVLLVDDDVNLRRVLTMQLTEAGYDVTGAASGEEAAALAGEGAFDVILTDLKMPGMGGLELLHAIKRGDPDAVVVMITAHGDVATAVEALKHGAFDFLTKPVSRQLLLAVIQRALGFRRLYFTVARQRQAMQEKYSFDHIVGTTSAMQRAFEVVRRAAPSDATVLIRGETGTGKELFARAIHTESDRASGPFVSLNCNAIPENLLESAFFGHEKGAFTGATARQIGCYEQAHGGTLFLDEIGLLEKPLQGKLLRLLETGRLRRVGGTRELAFDVRVVAATSSPLEEMVADGAFREDLYYRLCVVEIRLPPLRERLEDLPLLVDRLLVDLGQPRVRIAPEALERLAAHDWPGNVRELRNILERAVILARDPEVIGPEDVDIRALKPRRDSSPWTSGDDETVATLRIPKSGVDVAEIEKKLLEVALDVSGGNQSRAAAFLGLGRHAFIYRMRKYGLIDPAD